MQTMLRYIKKKQNKHIQNKIQRLTKQKQSIAPRIKQTKNKLNRKVIKEKKTYGNIYQWNNETFFILAKTKLCDDGCLSARMRMWMLGYSECSCERVVIIATK